MGSKLHLLQRNIRRLQIGPLEAGRIEIDTVAQTEQAAEQRETRHNLEAEDSALDTATDENSQVEAERTRGVAGSEKKLAMSTLARRPDPNTYK